jgi:hypothetical protein
MRTNGIAHLTEMIKPTDIFNGNIGTTNFKEKI